MGLLYMIEAHYVQSSRFIVLMDSATRDILSLICLRASDTFEQERHDADRSDAFALS